MEKGGEGPTQHPLDLIGSHDMSLTEVTCLCQSAKRVIDPHYSPCDWLIVVTFVGRIGLV